jgi:glyoxylase-like metal-dependent hydrolase (beta-lactamase superfamily II)
LVPGSFVPGRQPDGNSVMFRGPKGWIVVDTGRHREHTREILDYALQTQAPIRAVINTHWHLDHTGGNAMIREEMPGVRIYASAAIREAMRAFLAEERKQLVALIPKLADKPAQREEFRHELALIDAGEKLAPDVVITSSGHRTIAGRDLDIHLERFAATAGDLWIFDPETRILASGDLITLPVPFLDTACPAGWRAALEHLGRADFKTLVPGHGPPMDRKDFEKYRTGFDRLLDCAASSRTAEQCTDGWLHDVDGLVPTKEQDFARRLMGYYMGILRQDPAKTARLCGS